MCTAISFLSQDHYFGRNLDYEHSFSETIIITPRNFPLEFKYENRMDNHYAIIGMGINQSDYPLYFDCTNEFGLSFAGLNFPKNAHYNDYTESKVNITPYELPLWILGKCKNIKEAKMLLENINLLNIPFNEKFSLTPLHFILCDRNECIVYESTKEGSFVYDNNIGVLTNNPPFLTQISNLNNYMTLSSKEPENNFSENIDFEAYSRGMGAIGLPGDLSSMSRFVKVAFTKHNSVCENTEESSVSQFFHILYSVYQQRGCVCLADGSYEQTNYSSCCNTDKGVYYYTTYNNSRITKIEMYKENLDDNKLICYNLNYKQDILSGN